MLTRRSMFGGLLVLAAPAIIRTPGLLMSIKPLVSIGWFEVDWRGHTSITYQVMMRPYGSGFAWEPARAFEDENVIAGLNPGVEYEFELRKVK